MGQRWRLGIAVALVAGMALATALVWRAGDKPPAAAEPVAELTAEPVSPGDDQVEATPEAPTPSPAASADLDAVRPNEPPPALETTGEDFDRIWRSIEAYRDWLYAHPDPDLLANIYDPECHCWEDAHALLLDHQEKGDWWVGAVAVVKLVELLERPSPDTVTLRVVNDRPAGYVRDERGKTVGTQEAVKNDTYDFVLRRDESGRWRVFAFVHIGEEQAS